MSGRYALREVIGSGGCAHVVRAHRHRDPPDRPDVALKVLRGEMVGDAAVLRRFRDEARILAQLDHPHVVHCHELLDYDGRLVLELEYVEGATLENVLGAVGPIPPAVALGLVRQAAEALIAAFDTPGPDGRPMRIVHRDLKPANLAIANEGGLRLLDFGYAKGDFEGRAAQSLHDVWGTIGFDAPERKQGETTQASDVYALGVVVYVSLTTRAMLLSMKEAYHDEELGGLLDAVDDVDGFWGGDLRTLIRDCMHFAPDRRLTLPALIERIDALVDPVVARDALATFARNEVQALWRQRMVVEPAHDRSFSDLRFLEEVAPTPAMAPIPASEARARIEALLATDGWEQRVAEFDPILDASEDAPPDPLVKVLDRASVPFWKPWVRAATPLQLETALLLVLRIDPRVAREYAQGLADHPEERVRQAARFVLDS